MVEAYYHDNDDTVDFREPHHSGETLSLDQLAKIGVFYKYCPSQAQVDEVATERDYKNRDTVQISQETLGDALLPKLQTFYAEHLHEDEEIRYIIDGEGFFDVRNEPNDRWVRCKLACTWRSAHPACWNLSPVHSNLKELRQGPSPVQRRT